MPGPAPKDKETRARRNKPKTGDWVVLPEKNDGAAPPLPRIKGLRWLKDTRDWWSTIWASPMATQWQDADVPGLVDLAVCRQQREEMKTANRIGEQMKLAQYIERREDKFGLTPKGRRDLRWVITEEDAQSAGVERPLASVTRIRAT